MKLIKIKNNIEHSSLKNFNLWELFFCDTGCGSKIHVMPITKDELKQKIEIDSALVEQMKSSAEEAGQVVVHCSYQSISIVGSLNMDSNIRINKSTFLRDKDSGHTSKLIHVEGIPVEPRSKLIRIGEFAYFTLIFSGLPKTCKQFKFVEIETRGTPFGTNAIVRNKSDVYDIKLWLV